MNLLDLYESIRRMPQLVMTAHGWGPAENNDHNTISEREVIRALDAVEKLRQAATGPMPSYVDAALAESRIRELEAKLQRKREVMNECAENYNRRLDEREALLTEKQRQFDELFVEHQIVIQLNREQVQKTAATAVTADRAVLMLDRARDYTNKLQDAVDSRDEKIKALEARVDQLETTDRQYRAEIERLRFCSQTITANHATARQELHDTRAELIRARKSINAALAASPTTRGILLRDASA